MARDELKYSRIFDPKSRRVSRRRAAGTGYGDQRADAEYVYTEEITLAVNVALATARPLLIRGAAGSGKSSLGEDIARRMGWDFYVEVISSRTQARDLCWTFDAVPAASRCPGSIAGRSCRGVRAARDPVAGS